MTTPPHTRCLGLVAAFALSGALLVACNDDDGQGQATTASETPTTEVSVITTAAGTTTTVAATTTSTTMAATTTTTTTAPAPTSPPTSQQIDWIPIVEELYNRRLALRASPDSARVGEVAVLGSPAYEFLFRGVTDLQTKGWHAEYEPVEVARVDVDEATAAPAGTVLKATLTIWRQSGGLIAVVDADRNIVFPVTVEEVPPGMLSRNRITIERAGADQPWLFGDEVDVEPAAP